MRRDVEVNVLYEHLAVVVQAARVVISYSRHVANSWVMIATF